MRFSSLAKRPVFLTVLLILLTAAGCVRSAHPILKDEQVTANDALLGQWVASDGKTSAELQPAGNNRYKLTYINEDGEAGTYLLRFGKIGDLMVAELTAGAFSQKPGPDKNSLMLPLYSFIVLEKSTATSITANGMSADWVDKYLKNHPDELQQIEVGGQDGIINSSTEAVQAFIIRHLNDDGAMGKGQTYVRPKDPTTQPAK